MTYYQRLWHSAISYVILLFLLLLFLLQFLLILILTCFFSAFYLSSVFVFLINLPPTLFADDVLFHVVDCPLVIIPVPSLFFSYVLPAFRFSLRSLPILSSVLLLLDRSVGLVSLPPC